MTLTEFLLARIAEDEAVARGASLLWRPEGSPPWFDGTEKLWGLEQIKRWSPARVLDECESKRRVVDIHDLTHECPGGTNLVSDPDYEDGDYGGPCLTLRALALPYATHPDYDPAWAL